MFLSLLVKHLEHKNVGKQYSMQIDIVNVATQIAENVKPQSSVAIIGALADLMKHLRKCIQNAIESPNPEDGSYKCNLDLQIALENCISKLSHKVWHNDYSLCYSTLLFREPYTCTTLGHSGMTLLPCRILLLRCGHISQL